MSITVHTQAELDQALTDHTTIIYIDSPDGVWLTLTSTGSSRVVARGSSRVVARGGSRVVARGSSRVEARGSSSVEARGSSSVEARGSSSVEAWDSSRVEAWDSSSVEAWDSSSVEAWDSSSVVARGGSRVEAWDSSRVVAWDSSSVVAWGSSSVVAWGSSRVEARGGSSVEARGSSRVEARGSSSVEASKFVAVHLWSQEVTLAGGVVIDMTNLDLYDRQQWLDYHGITVTRHARATKSHPKTTALVYKAVDQQWQAGQGHTLTDYPLGATVIAGDWQPTQDCGHGLHFGASPSGARQYFQGGGQPRFLACQVDADQLIALGDKCKAESCVVLYEVDVHGDRTDMGQVSA